MRRATLQRRRAIGWHKKGDADKALCIKRIEGRTFHWLETSVEKDIKIKNQRIYIPLAWDGMGDADKALYIRIEYIYTSVEMDIKLKKQRICILLA